MTTPAPDLDVIDRAAGLAPGDALHAARRFRAKVVDATQASHDALFDEPVEGLTRHDRLIVAQMVCGLARVMSLEAHYAERVADARAREEPNSLALPAILTFAMRLTIDPRFGGQAEIETLREAGLKDPAIVALAQLVGFLSYQLRVVGGLRALDALKRREAGAAAEDAR